MTTTPTADLVPLTERLAPVRRLRGAVAALVVLGALTGATPLDVAPAHLVAVTLLYLVGLASLEEAWRRMRPTPGAGPVGLLLVIDGLYLAWAGAATGGVGGIVAYLVLLHVVGVTLLISYRTGVKIALWHVLLLYGSHHLHDLGALAAGGLGIEPARWLGVYALVVLVVAVATASLSAVNERELRRRRTDFEALAELATVLNTARDPRAVADALADRLRTTFGFARVVVLGGEDLRTVLGTAGGVLTDGVLAAGPGAALRRARAGSGTQLVGHLGSDDEGLAALLPGARNLLVVTLQGDGGTLGVVVAEHGHSRIEQRVVGAVERFADHGALALRAAYLLDAQRRLATIDGLTGTKNRRAFDQALAAEVSRAARAVETGSGGQVALLLLDIDWFKAVNDTHGHQVGDDVLRQVGATLLGTARGFDTVARYGGEEFAVILPGCDATAARAAAERLRHHIEHAETAVPVTASFGVALSPGHADTPEILVKAADDALLAAKEAGRNRVVLAPLDPAQPRDRLAR